MPSQDYKADILLETYRNNVVVFSKTYCPHADDTKKLLVQNGIPYKVYEFDKMSEGRQIQTNLKQMTGQWTVPSIWFCGNFIGGDAEFQRIGADKIKEMSYCINRK